MATSVKDLMAQREELDRKIAEMQKADRAAAIERIRAMMGESGLTLADLSTRAPATKTTRRASSGGGGNGQTGSKIAPKYRNQATGDTWSGRGLQPKWLKAAIGEGAKLDDFKI